MPCGGLTPFLLGGLAGAGILAFVCVNALWRANSISPGDLDRLKDERDRVSMPCGGLTPFLPHPMKLHTLTGVLDTIFGRIYQKIPKVS